jgi:hypothetical protein
VVKVTGEKSPIEVGLHRHPREQQSAFDLLACIATAARLPDGAVVILAKDEDEDEDQLRWKVLTLPEFEKLQPEDTWALCATAGLIVGASRSARNERR